MFDDYDPYYDDGCRNDLQRAHALECMETNLRDERDYAAKLTRDGKVVVMQRHAVYGKRTDAYVGSEFLIRKVCETEADAKGFIIYDHPEDDECSYYIFALQPPRQPEPEPEEEQDELPF